ncbi:restriction endonuclease subunit S [uncultured Lacinutrix sp.]|uniref:restriction endonuclease subunit S n=1 Tax=uncultured Lacinutrix sp. TaxID=574032 RepID=UPI0026168CEE|nr:restriction endonuclease subunit S [uncultured Lacinutrix sp.]
MKDNWKGELIENIFNVSSGAGLSEANFKPGSCNVYGGNGIIGFHSECTNKNIELIIGRVGAHCGNVYLTKKESWITDNALIISFIDKDVSYNFWYYLLKHLHLRNYAFQSAQPVITGGILKRIKVSFPPLPQQQKIAKILSTVDNVIEKTESAIAKYQAIKQGLMHDLFTRGIDVNTGKLRPTPQDAPELYKDSALGLIPKDWEVEELGSIGEFKNGVNKDKESFGSGTPFVNISDAYPEVLNTSNLSKVEVTSLEKSIYKLDKGDIIFVRSSVKPSGVGYTTLYEEESHTIIYCGFMIRFRLDDKINHNPFYYNNYFRYEDFRRRLLCVSTVSANTNVNQESLKKLLCIKPSKEEQIETNLKLISITNKIQTEQQALAKYQQLKAGLLQDLLTGKVEVKITNND